MLFIKYWIWLCVLHFRPYLQASKRELLADYALPCAVLLLSFVGSFVFKDIPGKNCKNWKNCMSIEWLDVRKKADLILNEIWIEWNIERNTEGITWRQKMR
jgi:hypothetical protein